MEFVKYQHIERFGTTEVDGIEFGECYIFPKIDGTNGSVWYDNGIRAGSRNRCLELDNDNHGFYKSVVEDEKLKAFFILNPNIRLFGEFLVPHTLKTYEDSAWRKFYVFDVMLSDGSYVPYDEYSVSLTKFGIDFIPPICKITNPTYERLVELLDKSTYLVKDGEGPGEGIVIKNYDFVNKYGRTTWAKIVRNEFKAKHNRTMITEIKEKKMIEEDIANEYVTEALVEKEYAKIVSECEGWSGKYIPRLLNTVYYSVVKEECWEFVKKNKNPRIDFGKLQYFCFLVAKKVKPEIF